MESLEQLKTRVMELLQAYNTLKAKHESLEGEYNCLLSMIDEALPVVKSEQIDTAQSEAQPIETNFGGFPS